MKSLREERATIRATMQAMLDKADAEKRDLSADESAKFDELRGKADANTAQLDRLAQARGFKNFDAYVDAGVAAHGQMRGAAATRNADFTLGREQRMADVVTLDGGLEFLRNERPLSIAKTLRGIVTGEWRDADLERRAMSIGTATAGGHLVPSPLSAEVIDLSRAQTRVIQAGARTVPMTASTLKIARATSDPAPAWREENAAVAVVDGALDAITLQARSVGALVKTSLELIEDAPNADEVISGMLASAIAIELDRVALRGSGTSPEPRGIQNTSGIQTITSVGDLDDYVPFSRAVQKIRQANTEPTAIILSPRAAGDLDRAVDTTGQPLQLPASLRDLPMLPTSQIPDNLGSGTDESLAFVANFASLLLGIRQNLVLEVSREPGFANAQVWIRALVRADVALARANHFCLLSGITSPE
jgi:HK97 family phage major capsid protein